MSEEGTPTFTGLIHFILYMFLKLLEFFIVSQTLDSFITIVPLKPQYSKLVVSGTFLGPSFGRACGSISIYTGRL